MAVTLNGNTSVISGLTNWKGVVAARYAYSQTAVTANSTADFFLNVQVDMPPLKTTGNRYQLIAFANTDNTASATSGCGLSLWGYIGNTGGSYWVHRQGHHAQYQSSATDRYDYPITTYTTDGTDWNGYSGGLQAGVSYSFRLYGHANNSNIYWGAGVSNQSGARIGLICLEISGDVFV